MNKERVTFGEDHLGASSMIDQRAEHDPRGGHQGLEKRGRGLHQDDLALYGYMAIEEHGWTLTHRGEEKSDQLKNSWP